MLLCDGKYTRPAELLSIVGREEAVLDTPGEKPACPLGLDPSIPP